MPKRKETLELENALNKQTRNKRLYGCEEITIGFHNNGHGNEIVDFMTMDSKGVIKCYELKVTLQDLKSNAKKSWYGHYNYIVVSKELYDTVKNLDSYIPKHVGVIVGPDLTSMKKAQRCNITNETEIMLKESLVRSMFWKMDKYRDAQNIEKQKLLQSKIRKLENERDRYYKEKCEAENLIYSYENYKSYNDNLEDFDFKKEVELEKEKYRRKRKMK